MNIFYLHRDPVIAAKVHYNKHIVKMILESAQMLCTAHHEIMGEDADVPYKRAHVNHPSTIWCRSSAQNYAWLYDHFVALAEDAVVNSNKDLKYLVKESQTPRGLNEQGVKELRKSGFYRSIEKTLNSILKRLNKL